MYHANRVNGKTAYSYIGPSISIPYFLYYLYIYLCYLYYIIYCYTCVDFENKISKISSWDKVKCVDDTCMWPGPSRQHVHAWFDLCAHNGITLNPKKFQFAQDTVDFAELSSTPTNVRPSTKLLDAMRDFPTPTDISGTRAWFGLVNQGTNAFAMTQQMKPFAIYWNPQQSLPGQTS